MVVLQKPRLAYYRGAIGPWEGASLHVSCQGVYLGINVFEGLKAYWQPGGALGVVALRRHYERLRRSASLLHIPFDMPLAEFEDAVHGLLDALSVPDNELWVRATLYITEGFWGIDQSSDLVLTAFQCAKEPPPPIHVGVSTWRRAADTMLPSRIKTSTNYQSTRLAKIEGRERGYSEMILLNAHDRVAEAGGACVLAVRDGEIVTPPASEGTLESITVDIVEALARDAGIPFSRRPLDRTELYIADELALAGTLAEVTPIASIDGRRLGTTSGILASIGTRYRAAARGVVPHPCTQLSIRTPSRTTAEVADAHR